MDTLKVINISEAERQRRLDAVKYARASIALEGFGLSAVEERRAQAFINGELTSAEFFAEDRGEPFRIPVV